LYSYCLSVAYLWFEFLLLAFSPFFIKKSSRLFLCCSVLVVYNTIIFLVLFKEQGMTPQWDPEKPIYLQLYQQVVTRILDGNIKEGEALPSVRKVAAEYRLNPITISKAYQMLQDEEVVEKQRGKGLFVMPGAQVLMLDRERESFLSHQWPEVLKQITRLKLSPAELLTSSVEH